MIHECEGNCEHHTENIKLVEVISPFPAYNNWGTFWYCEEAIKTDRANGLTVNILE